MGIIDKLLKDIEKSAAPGLKDRSRQQGEVALEEVKARLLFSSNNTPLLYGPLMCPLRLL
jgi:hypothetical protein